MDKKLLIVIIGLYIFTLIKLSLTEGTELSETFQTLTKDVQTDISSSYSLTAKLALPKNETDELAVEGTGSSKRKKLRLKKERPRRQAYGFSPARYGLFDMCPALATTCPECNHEMTQAPAEFCNSIVLKVLAISAPQEDSSGRVCGKFGMLKLYGGFNEKDFRRLLRFSVWKECGCSVQASKLYFLIAPLSSFLKDGLLYNQIVFNEQTILISADRYVEKEILEVLNVCPVTGNNNEVPAPYVPPPVPPPIPYTQRPPYSPPPTQSPAPYVHLPSQPPAPYVVPPPAPYVPPPSQPPAPYVAPPPAPYVEPPPVSYVDPPTVPHKALPPAPYVAPPPAPYVEPPPATYVSPTPVPYVAPPPVPHVGPPPVPYAVPPPAPYVAPSPAPYVPSPAPYLPMTTSPLKQPTSGGKLPFLYPSLAECLVPDTCPICSRLDSAGDITAQYCTAGFAYLAVIRFPDTTNLQGGNAAYSNPACLNLRTNIVYDITRTRDPQILVTALTSLLSTKCLECFTGLKGPVIVLMMGQVPPAPPTVQLDTSFQIYILPVPVTIVLPSCDSYYLYGRPNIQYSLLPEAPQPYAFHDCPAAGEQTCPLCQNYPEAEFAYACANGFAIVAELNLAGPYFTSQRLPAISVKTTTTYYSKSIEVIITNPPPIECIKGFFEIPQNIGLAPLNFPGEIIPFVSLPSCDCLSKGLKRVLIFSSAPLTISSEGYLYLSKDINIASLQPDAVMPSCSPGNPPVYTPSPSPLYTSPPSAISPYARPARVPLSYLPPPPPPPEYIHPTDKPPVHLLQPHYLPPPIKDYHRLPPPFYLPPQHPDLRSVLPKNQPQPITTEPPFEDPIAPIVGCVKFGDGSCFALDPNHDNKTVVGINVDEDIPFPPPYDALNALIYEDSSVWAPSFVECLPSVERSCPYSLEEYKEKFEKFYCEAGTALLVAVGIDYSSFGSETAAERRLTFIQPELPYIGIDFVVPNDPVSVKVTITSNKTMDRRIQLVENADYCYKERVVVLADLSFKWKPRVVVGGLDVYIPGFCNSEIFDKAPSYGILLSTQQPSDVKNPVQLTEDFSFLPIPEGKLSLPLCGISPANEVPPTDVQVQKERFWVPKNPLESVTCQLSNRETCGVMTSVQEEVYTLPCDDRSAALVLVQKTSAGGSVGPNLEILETTYETGEKTVVLSVELNIDKEDEFSSPQNEYEDGLNRCKYAAVKVLKDFSRQPTVKEDDVFTIIGNTNCDHPIFKLTNEVVLLLSHAPLTPNTVIPLVDDRTEVVGIPPGTTTISFCNAKLPYEENDGVVQVLEESKTSNDDIPLPAEPVHIASPLIPAQPVKMTSPPIPAVSVKMTSPLIPDVSYKMTSPRYETSSAKYENTPIIESNKVLEPSCKGHSDDSCPVCGDIGSIPPEVFCKAGVTLFSEAFSQEPVDGACKKGVILSLVDIKLSKGVPESKIHKISYTIPSHCHCPALNRGAHLFLLLEESLPNKDNLSITLSKEKYLYSSPLKTPLPSCHLKDSIQARTKDTDNVIVLELPHGDILKIMPELSDHVCPTIDHTCPVCKSMDDQELKDLYCSSKEVLWISKNKSQKEYPRKFTRYGKATFTQRFTAGNNSLEMNIDKYEGACGLPLDAGNCNDSLTRYYYDAVDETCSEFPYTGCGGNANKFVSEDDCEENCLVEDFCEEGVLDIKKILKSSDDANYLDSKFHYALPEHCNCWQTFKGKKDAYLFRTKSESFEGLSIQLSQNFHLVPLSRNQKKIRFSCPNDDGAHQSSEIDTDDNEGLEKKKEKKGWTFFG